jgi:hypothetical protein
VATHLWLIWQRRFAGAEKRAFWIKKGQGFFVLFLAGVLLLSILTAFQRGWDFAAAGPSVRRRAGPAVKNGSEPSVTPSAFLAEFGPFWHPRSSKQRDFGSTQMHRIESCMS